MPPLGILTLGAVLEDNGHEVSVLDLAGVNDWKHHIKSESKKLDNADFIGYSATTPQYNISQQISRYIKNGLGYSIPSSCGGMHITSEVYSNNFDFLNSGGFDSYCTGEGYNSVLKMCDDLKDRGRLKNIYSEPIWKDVNTLPYADRDLLDIRSYYYRLGDVKATTIYSSYGCYYECGYCESKMAGSFTVRSMTPKRLADEVRYIRDKWAFDGFTDFSDEMNLDKKRFMGICSEFRKLNITWRGFLVVAKIDDEMFQAMKNSGCYECATGVESFSPTILKTIRKPATADMNMKFIRMAKKNGVRIKIFMIVGLPGETWRTIKETVDSLNILKNEGYAPDDLDVSILQVYHGSNIYRDREKLDIKFEDYMDNVDKMYYKSSPDSYTDLIQVQTQAMSKYDLIAARNYIEFTFKKPGWLEDYTGRKDLDKIYENDVMTESIKYAEEQLRRL